MTNKLSLALAPLLVIAALTVIPAAAQGACTAHQKLLGVETVTTPTTRTVTNAIAAKFFLNENVDRRRWTAAALVCIGVYFLAH